MPNIVFDQVSKSYGDHEVLPPFNLDLKDGEFTVLVGPSGCGKSTTLRMLAGLETISGGEIFFDGRPISRLEPKDRDIAMVFQDYALYPHMNIARNMSFALRLQNVPRDEIDRRVGRVAETLGISHLLDRKPGALSGGQRQRVAMGRAMVRDASTFLFDEPLSNLDAKLRGRMRTELAQMRDTIDKNMVYVTHDQIEAMTLGDRIVVMSDGRIQQQGTPEELFREPRNTFVAAFIGSPTINLLDGEIAEEDGRTWLRGDGFRLPIATTADLGALRSRAVTAGIRPSSFTADPAQGEPIELRIEVAEYLGAQTVLLARCGGQEVTVEITSATRMKVGATRTFGVLADEILLFDRTSGERV